jgi:hypothetical protein
MGDPETKRKRYCLMCNVFKPDRCHHCSACNRCVLNMDHHCPWVNNCIGFWNRKYFLLLLFYSLCTIYLYISTMIGTIINTVFYLIDVFSGPIEVERLALALLLDVSFIFIGFLGIVMTKFTFFHLYLVRKNITTIESLEHKGLDYESLVRGSVTRQYDVGMPANWHQVFGKNPALWLFPFVGRSGKPVGNGVSWPLRSGGDSINLGKGIEGDLVSL